MEDTVQAKLYYAVENLLMEVNTPDSLLKPLLDSSYFVSVEQFKKMEILQSISTSEALIEEALKLNAHLLIYNLNKTMLRPITLRLLERTTLLLRDTDNATNEDSINALVQEEKAQQEIKGKILAFRLEVGNNWFVLFDSEAACMNAAIYLRGKILDGKKIACAVKSDSHVQLPHHRFRRPVFAPPEQFGNQNSNPIVQPSSSIEDAGFTEVKKSKGRGSVKHEPKAPEQVHILATGANLEGSGYSEPFILYSREKMASIVANLSTLPGVPQSLKASHLIAAQPLLSSQLSQPFPLVCPSSPSPMLNPKSGLSPNLAADIAGSPSLKGVSDSVAAFSLGSANNAPVPSISMGGLNAHQSKKTAANVSSGTVLSSAAQNTKKGAQISDEKRGLKKSAVESKEIESIAAENKSVESKTAEIKVADAKPIASGQVDSVWGTKRTAASIVALNAIKPVVAQAPASKKLNDKVDLSKEETKVVSPVKEVVSNVAEKAVCGAAAPSASFSYAAMAKK